ncbi:MAG: sulfatase [Deltaproteobacteria bacterium]|nr:sulfatase [Deltaproteobacteria bacterium]
MKRTNRGLSTHVSLAVSLGAALALAALTLGCERAVPPAEIASQLLAEGPPNIVLIVVDTLRPDFTGPYGFEADTTPELSRWAERGVVFERARAQSSWTKISMASFMTSLWPRSVGITEPGDGLAQEALTLAEVLQQNGYATYGVQTNGWLHQSFGFHQGFDRYMSPKPGGDPRLGRALLWPHADRVIEEAGRLLEAHDAAKPFFLYLHFMDVHEFAAPPEFKTFGTDSRGAYLAAIRWVDDALKSVREKLEETGDLERTLVVFASDHGETFGEHGVHGHARNVLTPVVWVPLLFRFPFSLDPGLRVAAQARNIDIAPTLLELVGVKVPPGFEGESLVAHLSGDVEQPDRPTFAALGMPLFPDASVQSAVNDGLWTYARNASPPEGDEVTYQARAVAPGAEYLFDRRVDPGENVNLVTREPAAVARMRAVFDRHEAEGSGSVAEKDVRIDPAIADRLRAMGYLR